MRIVLLLLSLMLALPLSAKTLPKVKSVTDYWSPDETKSYQFFVNDEKIGEMSAELEDVDDGVCSIHEKLDLDLARVGMGPRLEINSDLQVLTSGIFSSCKLTAEANGATQKLEIVFNDADNTIRSIKDGDDEHARTQTLDQPLFACDNNMISQLEMLLAFRDLVPGDTMTIPVYSPQGNYTAGFFFHVVGQTMTRYGVFRDSVWQVEMLRPTQQTLYVDRTHDLVKITNKNQSLRVEYQRDPFENRPNVVQKVSQQTGGVDALIRRIPFYGLMLAFGAFWLLFLGRDSYRDKWSYIMFIISGCLYPLVYITQVPLQQDFAVNYLTPIMQSGGSIILPAAVPALIGGIIHETLKLLPLLFVALVVRPKALVLISIGAFVGAGFGFVEGCYISGPLFQARLLTGTIIAERLFAVLLHTVTGALIGYGFAKRKWWMFWLIAIGFHSLANYLVVFVATKVISTKGLQTLLAFYDLILLGNMFYLQWRFKSGHVGGKKKR